MNFIRSFISGIIIGVANIIPGVSGGTMAVVLGIYDKLIGAITLNFKKIKENWKFLLAVFAGAGAGIILFAKLLTYLFENYNVPTQFFFIGLILGSIPLVWRKTTEYKKFQPINIIPFLITLGVMIAMSILNAGENVVETKLTLPLFLTLLVTSMVAAVSMIIPGISGSFVLKALGQYDTVLAAIDRMDVAMLIPVAIGVGLGIVGGAKLISILLKKFQQGIYSAIFGLVIGSVFVIYPREFAFNLQGIIAIFVMIVGGAIPILMDSADKKRVK